MEADLYKCNNNHDDSEPINDGIRGKDQGINEKEKHNDDDQNDIDTDMSNDKIDVEKGNNKSDSIDKNMLHENIQEENIKNKSKNMENNVEDEVFCKLKDFEKEHPVGDNEIRNAVSNSTSSVVSEKMRNASSTATNDTMNFSHESLRSYSMKSESEIKSELELKSSLSMLSPSLIEKSDNFIDKSVCKTPGSSSKKKSGQLGCNKRGSGVNRCSGTYTPSPLAKPVCDKTNKSLGGVQTNDGKRNSVKKPTDNSIDKTNNNPGNPQHMSTPGTQGKTYTNDSNKCINNKSQQDSPNHRTRLSLSKQPSNSDKKKSKENLPQKNNNSPRKSLIRTNPTVLSGSFNSEQRNKTKNNTQLVNPTTESSGNHTTKSINNVTKNTYLCSKTKFPEVINSKKIWSQYFTSQGVKF